MEQYISKSALVAEVEKHLKYATNGIEYAQMGIDKGLEHYKEELAIWQHCQSMCHNILSFINSLEVKEVDNVWHDANHQPTMYRKYLVRYSDGRVSGSWERHDNGFIPWKDVVKEHGFTHWCYVEDLLKL